MDLDMESSSFLDEAVAPPAPSTEPGANVVRPLSAL